MIGVSWFSYKFLFRVRLAALLGVCLVWSLSHLRSIRRHIFSHDFIKQYQGSMSPEDAALCVSTSFKILSQFGLCTFGQKGGSIALVKPSDPEVLLLLISRISALFRLPPERVSVRMNTRLVNHDFDPAAFEDLFHRLSPKTTAFWNSEDAVRRDELVGLAVPIADAAFAVGSPSSASTAHHAVSDRPLSEELHADESEPVRPVVLR